MNELLALRDGEGAAETARHVEGCERCRAEIEALRAAASALRSLPECAPPSEAWRAIRRRIDHRRRRAIAIRLGVAAAVILLVSMASIVGRLETTDVGMETMTTDGARETVEQLASASRELEMVLQGPALRSPVLTPQRAAMIVELEDRIALVDMALADNPEKAGDRAVVLWSDRVELLDALVAVKSGAARSDSVALAVNRNHGRQK